MADRVGQQLGNYQLIRLLGEGGFAEVYLGEHIHLGTQAAIKVLHTQLTSDDLDKFRTEARTIAHLIHPNIVRVFEFGVEGKAPFLVMDYAPNGTLRQRHPKGIPLPLATVVSYVKQVADALQYAHGERVIHRDIKPENMLLGRRNEILLSDFGIAIVAQSSRYQNTLDMAGTIAYMAPEQIQAHPRPASDQYSLGIVVYEWLSGDRPFHGSFTEIAIKHSVVPPPSLREKVPAIPYGVEQVVMTALAKDPRQRFVSVQAFANALEQASRSTQLHSFTQAGMSNSPNPLPPPIVRVAPPNQVPQAQPIVGFTPPGQLPPSMTGANPPGQLPQPNIIATMPSGPQPPKRGISRRTILLGLVGLATVGGGLTWLALSQKLPFLSNAPSVPTPTRGSTSTTGGTTPPASPTTSTILAPNDLITPGVLTVGSDTTYPPQEYIDTTTGQPAGFDIDLITAMAQRIGLQTRIVTANFNTILDDLVARHFDVVISAVTINPQRQQQVDFVPYFNAGESLLVQAGNPRNITGLADLCGLNVGVQDGTVELNDLQAASNSCKAAGKAGINITVLRDQTAVVGLLANNRVVATYQDSPVTDYYIKLNPGQFNVGGSVVNAVPEGIAIRKGDTSMFHAVQAAFNQLKANGTYHNLFQKWGLSSGEISAVEGKTILI